jgi:hypothetical protein
MPSASPVGAVCGGIDELCESQEVCVGGVCQDGPQAQLEVCDGNYHKDCDNNACGREFFNSSSDFICCPTD